MYLILKYGWNYYIIISWRLSNWCRRKSEVCSFEDSFGMVCLYTEPSTFIDHIYWLIWDLTSRFLKSFSFIVSDYKFMVIDVWGWTWRHGIPAGFVILLFAIGSMEKRRVYPLWLVCLWAKNSNLELIKEQKWYTIYRHFCVTHSVHFLFNISPVVGWYIEYIAMFDTYIHTCLHTYIHTYLRTHILTYIHFLCDCKLLEQEKDSLTAAVLRAENWPVSKNKLINKFNKNFKKLRTIYRMTDYRQLYLI